nr:MAG TPA: hypothetical protein [Caudoviricetes sp.]
MLLKQVATRREHNPTAFMNLIFINVILIRAENSNEVFIIHIAPIGQDLSNHKVGTAEALCRFINRIKHDKDTGTLNTTKILAKEFINAVRLIVLDTFFVFKDKILILDIERERVGHHTVDEFSIIESGGVLEVLLIAPSKGAIKVNWCLTILFNVPVVSLNCGLKSLFKAFLSKDKAEPFTNLMAERKLNHLEISGNVIVNIFKALRGILRLLAVIAFFFFKAIRGCRGITELIQRDNLNC